MNTLSLLAKPQTAKTENKPVIPRQKVRSSQEDVSFLSMKKKILLTPDVLEGILTTAIPAATQHS